MHSGSVGMTQGTTPQQADKVLKRIKKYMNVKKTRLVIIMLIVALGIGNSIVINPFLNDKVVKITLDVVVLIATVALAVLLVVNESRKE
jgi:hypothetical protein